MAMNLQGDDHDVMMDMNTTPLIDVMLVLLVMLIITIPVQLHSIGINMPVPTPSNLHVEPKIIKIDLDTSGKVFWNGQLLVQDGEIKNRFIKISEFADQPEIHIKPSSKTRYKYVAHILAVAQSHGIKKIGVITSSR